MEMIPLPWLGFLRGVFLANHLASNDNLGQGRGIVGASAGKLPPLSYDNATTPATGLLTE